MVREGHRGTDAVDIEGGAGGVIEGKPAKVVGDAGGAGERAILLQGQRAATNDGGTGVGVVARESRPGGARPRKIQIARQRSGKGAATRGGERAARGAGDNTTRTRRGVAVAERTNRLIVAIQIKGAAVDIQRLTAADGIDKNHVVAADEPDRAPIDMGGAGVALADIEVQRAVPSHRQPGRTSDGAVEIQSGARTSRPEEPSDTRQSDLTAIQTGVASEPQNTAGGNGVDILSRQRPHRCEPGA